MKLLNGVNPGKAYTNNKGFDCSNIYNHRVVSIPNTKNCCVIPSKEIIRKLHRVANMRPYTCTECVYSGLPGSTRH